jgi:tetratricopeptide (TPR) repeat protein
MDNHIEEENYSQNAEENQEEKKTDIYNSNINNSNNVNNPSINQNINVNNVDDIEISSDDFLEKSLINEIKKTISQLETHCDTLDGEAAVETRCRILSYATILVDVYKKPISNLIYPYAKLGEAYYDIKYYAQAEEHFGNALKYNNDKTNEQYQTLPEDYLLRLTIKLSKCFLENKKYDSALKLAMTTLNRNKKFFGENDTSNAEIYDIIFQAEKNMNQYSEAIEHLKILYQFYIKIYDEKSDKCIMTLKEIALLYEIEKEYDNSLEYFFKYFNSLEDIELKNKIKEIYDTAMKIGGLYAEINKYKEAYDFLKKIDNEYNNGFNKTDKDKCDYQNFLCTLAYNLKNDSIYLNELIALENILIQCKKIDSNLLGNTYLNIGDIYKKQNEFDKSIEYYKKAMNIYKKNSDGKLLVYIQKIIKEIEKEKRNYEINKI